MSERSSDVDKSELEETINEEDLAGDEKAKTQLQTNQAELQIKPEVSIQENPDPSANQVK